MWSAAAEDLLDTIAAVPEERPVPELALVARHLAAPVRRQDNPVTSRAQREQVWPTLDAGSAPLEALMYRRKDV